MVNIDILKSSGVKAINRGALLVKKFSPEILTAVGIVGMVGTVVLASRATLKLEPIVEKIKDGKFEADYCAEEEILQTGNYNKQAHTKAIANVYVHGAIDISKLYATSITLGLSSIGCIIAAHGIMQRRAVAIAAAYKTLETSFIEYRKRVAAEIGEKREEDIRLGREKVEITDEKGKTKKVDVIDPNGLSPYAKFFDELSENWSKTPEYNLLFLKAQQNYANDLLRARGHLFLNEVYDMLGVPRTQAGQVVGWVISDNGDNFVDFGMYDINKPGSHEFVNGYERSILLDFNVDGVIYDLI